MRTRVSELLSIDSDAENAHHEENSTTAHKIATKALVDNPPRGVYITGCRNIIEDEDTRGRV